MINAILACDNNNGIGKNNQLPWPRNEYDMKWFRENTMGHIVVMGRKTWESIGSKKLPGRINCVLTNRDISNGENPDHILSGDINKALALLTETYKDKKIWIIGGADIYKQVIPLCNHIYLTTFSDIYDCDIFIDSYLFNGFIKLTEKTKGDCNFSIWGRV